MVLMSPKLVVLRAVLTLILEVISQVGCSQIWVKGVLDFQTFLSIMQRNSSKKHLVGTFSGKNDNINNKERDRDNKSIMGNKDSSEEEIHLT